MKTKVLITGSEGYIGTNLIEQIQGIDQYDLVLPSKDEFKLIVKGALDIPESATVIHLANRAHNKKDTFVNDTDCEDMSGLLKASIRAKVTKFIYLSSVAVYKNDGNTTFKEESTQFSLNESIVFQKLDMEKQIIRSHGASNLHSFCIFRPALIYGVNPPGNLSKLVFLAKNVKLNPFTKLRAKRHYLNMELLIKCLIHEIKRESCLNNIYNIADSNQMTTGELLCKLARLNHHKIYTLPIPEFFFRLIFLLPVFNRMSHLFFDDLIVSTDKLKQDYQI